jgi:uncharacterized protein YutE (UPF0331/DUF86 family)
MTPGDLDLAVVRRHLFAIDEALRILRKHQGKSADVLISNHEERWIVERGLQLCAQNALDVATHVAASAGHDVADYASAVDRLTGMAILPAEFAARFRAIAGFRNIIVHAYLDVDTRALHRLLNERLDDFAEFSRYVSDFLGSRS